MVPTIDKSKSIGKGFIYRKILFPTVGALLLATQTGCSQHRSRLGIGMGAKIVNFFRNKSSHSTPNTNNSSGKEEPLGNSRDGQNGFVLNIDKQVQCLKNVRTTLMLLYRSKSVTEHKAYVYVKNAIDNLDDAIENYDLLKFLMNGLYKNFESSLDLSPDTPPKNNSIESKKQLGDSNDEQNRSEVTLCQQLTILDGIKNDLLLFSKSQLGMDDMVNNLVGEVTHSVDQAWRDISSNDGIRKGLPRTHTNKKYSPILSSIAEEDNDQDEENLSALENVQVVSPLSEDQADDDFEKILEDLEASLGNLLFELDELECEVIVPQENDSVEASTLKGNKVGNGLVHQVNSWLAKECKEFNELYHAFAPPKDDRTKSKYRRGLNYCSRNQDKEKLATLSSKKTGEAFIALCKYKYELEKRIKSRKTSESELIRLRRNLEDTNKSIKEVSSILCWLLTSSKPELVLCVSDDALSRAGGAYQPPLSQVQKESDANLENDLIDNPAAWPNQSARSDNSSTSIDQQNQVVKRSSKLSKEQKDWRKVRMFGNK